MYKFITLNKKSVFTAYIATSIGMTIIWLVALYFMVQYQSISTKEILFSILGVSFIFPLLLVLVVYIKWLVYKFNFNRNVKFPAFYHFLKNHNFINGWYDSNKKWAVNEPCMYGNIKGKKIICKIDDQFYGRLDFIICELDENKIIRQKTVLRNVFDLEEPRFLSNTIYKSFNKRKSLTPEKILKSIEELISKYG